MNANKKLLKHFSCTEDFQEYKIVLTIKKSSIERLYRSGGFLSPWRSKEVLKDLFCTKLAEELKEHFK